MQNTAYEHNQLAEYSLTIWHVINNSVTPNPLIYTWTTNLHLPHGIGLSLYYHKPSIPFFTWTFKTYRSVVLGVHLRLVDSGVFCGYISLQSVPRRDLHILHSQTWL